MDGLMEAADFVQKKARSTEVPTVTLYPAGGGFNALRAAEKFRLDDLLEEFIDDYNEAPVKDAFIEHVILKQMKVHMWDGTPKAGYPYEPRTDELCKRIGQRMRDLRKKRKAAETALIEGAIEGAKKSKNSKEDAKGYLYKMIEEQGNQIKALQGQFDIMLKKLTETQQLLLDPSKASKMDQQDEPKKESVDDEAQVVEEAVQKEAAAVAANAVAEI